MHRDDARVARHPARCTRLAQKAALLGFGVQLAFVDLDRDEPVQRLLAGFPYDRKATPGDGAPIRHTRESAVERGQPRDQDSSETGTP